MFSCGNVHIHNVFQALIETDYCPVENRWSKEAYPPYFGHINNSWILILPEQTAFEYLHGSAEVRPNRSKDNENKKNQRRQRWYFCLKWWRTLTQMYREQPGLNNSPAVWQRDCKCVLAAHQCITFRRKINSVVADKVIQLWKPWL